MSVTSRLDFNLAQQAFEPARYEDSMGALIGWRGAAVLHGGADLGQLYQAANDGRVYEAETGLTDNAVAIGVLGLTKRYSLDAVCMAHSLYIRLEAATDTLTAKVRMGGAEYGEIEREYTASLSGSDDKEIRIRLHREQMGRWISVELSGDFLNRPAIREMILRVIPLRSGRVSV